MAEAGGPHEPHKSCCGASASLSDRESVVQANPLGDAAQPRIPDWAGVRLLPGGVLINEVLLARTPAIIDDRKDPMFWSAIIGGEQDVIEMTPEEQEQVRQFILDENWTLPVMAWEHRSLRHKLTAVGTALVGERSRGRTDGGLLVGGE